MSYISRWMVRSASLLVLFGAAGAAAAGEALRCVILPPAKEAAVTRPGRAPEPARGGEIIPQGTTVRVPSGRSVSVACSSGRLLRLKGATTWTLTPGACAEGKILSLAQVRRWLPQGGRLVFLQGFMATESLMRAGEKIDKKAPHVLAPRWTAVRDPRPEIRWTWIEGASIYEINVSGRGEGSFQERVDAEQVSCRSSEEWSGVRVCALPWPTSRPALVAGQPASLQVNARNRNGVRTEGLEVSFHLLPTEDLAGIVREEQGLKTLELEDAASHMARAGLFAQNRLYGDAIEEYRRALALAPAPVVEVTLGDLYLMVGLLDRARSLYEANIEKPAPDLRAAASFGLGRVEQAEGAFAAAGDRYRQAADLYAEAGLHVEAELARQSEERVRQTPPLVKPGTDAATEDQLQAAADASYRSLEHARASGDLLMQEAALQSLANTFAQLPSHPRETEYLMGMAEAAHDLGQPARSGLLRLQLGLSWLQRREPTRAIEALQQGLAGIEGRGFPEEEKSALKNLAFAHRMRGDYEEELRYGERLLRAANNEPRWIGPALFEIGTAQIGRGDLVPALQSLEGSVEAFEKVASSEDRLLPVLMTLGNLRFGLGDYERSLEVFQRLVGLARKQGDRTGEIMGLLYQSGSEFLLGETGEAHTSLATARELSLKGAQKPYVVALLKVLEGTYAFLAEDFRKTIGHYQEALALLEQSGVLAGPQRHGQEVVFHGLQARAYALLNEFPRALDLSRRSMTAAESSGRSLDRAIALDHLAFVQFYAGHLEEAEVSLREAIVLFEQDRYKTRSADIVSALMLDSKSTAYDLLQQVLVRRGMPEEALAIAERARARAFLEVLRPGVELPVPTPALLRKAAISTGATLVELSLLHDPARPLAPGRIEGAQAGFEHDLFLWVIAPSGQVTFRSVDLATERQGLLGDTLARRILDLRSTLSRRSVDPEVDRREIRRQLRDLHDLLIAPIADLLPADPDAPVVFVPHGPLFQVPFPALLDAAGRYLIEKHTLLVAPSIEALAAFRRPEGQAPGAPAAMGESLIVGNPIISPRLAKQHNLAPLTQADKEARQIATALGAAPLIGEQATRTAVLERMPRARLLHFATHGLLDAGDREQPGALVLAPESPEDQGLLDAVTVRGLRLQADLVVLSACDSGRGKLSGDGVIGLARSFLAAGAAGAVTSLWRIDDKATADLMGDFYGRFLAGSDPARSLRAAMRAAIERGAEPRHWGAFLFMGSPGSASRTSS